MGMFALAEEARGEKQEAPSPFEICIEQASRSDFTISREASMGQQGRCPCPKTPWKTSFHGLLQTSEHLCMNVYMWLLNVLLYVHMGELEQ